MRHFFPRRDAAAARFREAQQKEDLVVAYILILWSRIALSAVSRRQPRAPRIFSGLT